METSVGDKKNKRAGRRSVWWRFQAINVFKSNWLRNTVSRLTQIRDAYEIVQLHACHLAQNEIRAKFNLGNDFYLTLLNNKVLEAVQAWPPKLPVWEELFRCSNNCRPKNFSVAMYNHKHVYGVAFGRVSKGKTHVRIDYMEAHPGPHPWKGMVLHAAIWAAQHYAAELGAKRVLLTNPLPDVKLRERYAENTDFYVPPNSSPFEDGHYVINLES